MNKTNSNAFLNLNYNLALENLGNDYYDIVPPAEFPQHILRWRNDSLLPLLGLDPNEVSEEDFITAFGQFQGVRPFLALRYHGYQFGSYNPFLGDGRGFLYGQVRGVDGTLYDFGTKGSGKTPYSRSADGRLTLKGGVREVLAAEALHSLGVRTSRCLSLVETGESLWRQDEPSPTRSSVMVRLSRSHIRFGTFERLHYIQRSDLIKKLLNHVIETYYSHLPISEEGYVLFYAELVKRVAELVAQWMAAGFCHGVLNTDNMSITGESFDYGPYGFIPTYDPRFIAAYFDYGGLYSYGNQPFICRLNLERLQVPLALVIPMADLEAGLALFDDHYHTTYRRLMMKRLGFETLSTTDEEKLLKQTVEMLKKTQIGYSDFFSELTVGFNEGWKDHPELILENASFANLIGEEWKKLYSQMLNVAKMEELKATNTAMKDVISIQDRLSFYNPKTALLRPVIESIWQPIIEDNDWQPFYDLVHKLQTKE